MVSWVLWAYFATTRYEICSELWKCATPAKPRVYIKEVPRGFGPMRLKLWIQEMEHWVYRSFGVTFTLDSKSGAAAKRQPDMLLFTLRRRRSVFISCLTLALEMSTRCCRTILSRQASLVSREARLPERSKVKRLCINGTYISTI